MERNGSILNDYKLTVERLEGAIAVGRSKSQILAMFHVTPAEMDSFCQENYNGHGFPDIYEWVRQCTVDEYLQAVYDLGMRGNPSALGIIDRAIQKDESAATTKIVFAGLPGKESDEDKRVDSEGGGD